MSQPLHIELVVIGNEVLTGNTINTNAAYIGQSLFEQGYQLSRQTVLPDAEKDLLSAVPEALKRSDLVITTGGLGPTIDDITRKVMAQIFDSGFHFDENVASDIKRRFQTRKQSELFLQTLTDQSTVPSKAAILLNPIGTAPGFVFRSEKGTLIMLPGVPNEMKPMFHDQVMPYIQKHFPLSSRPYRKILNLSGVFEQSVDPHLRDMKKQFPEVEFGIYPALGILNVHLTSSNEESLSKPYEIIRKAFESKLFESPSGRIEDGIHQLFIKNQWTLGIAESMTGGAVSSALTQIPGASGYFMGSIVCYSNQVKTGVLGVSKQLLQEHGAVSQEVAQAMLEGTFNATQSEFALAVTGIAGPGGGTPEKPIGTVWCAVGRKGKNPEIWECHAKGTRSMIITRTINELLSRLYHYAVQ